MRLMISRRQNAYPTHMKIDVDGAETEVLKGAASILANPSLKQVFIEIDNENLDIIDQMTSYGFEVKWSVKNLLTVMFVHTRLSTTLAGGQ